jgi:hypothetical protein
MNVITRAKSTARLNQLPQITFSLPIYACVMLLLTAIMVMLVAGRTMPLRQVVEPSNPFSEYLAIWPGQPWNSSVAQPFFCNPNNSVDSTEYCTRTPPDGPFSLIAIIVSDRVVSRVDLAVREGMLMAGDLALVWGNPTTRLYRQSVHLDWPDIGVTVSAWAESRRFSYFIPVIRLSFTRPSEV